ncbi:hypothetical protein BN961_00459 [Afipia felis]|uniref:Uncharacterized protein n=1 Tax=Afipia felis TaxID=1035 RepID=A0A090N6L8_AFIFE|nr:hypothetical protein BN961_00459 [Afipia felis]
MLPVASAAFIFSSASPNLAILLALVLAAFSADIFNDCNSELTCAKALSIARLRSATAACALSSLPKCSFENQVVPTLLITPTSAATPIIRAIEEN